MTCKEKFEIEFPNRSIGSYCPNELNYLPEDDNYCSNHSCKECWDREIPETEDMCASCTLLKMDGDKKTCPNMDRKFTEKVILCHHHKTHTDEVCELVEKMAKKGKKTPNQIRESVGMPLVDEDDLVMRIKDSGARREFATGAVSDIHDGKGRCDLMPLDVVAEVRGQLLNDIYNYQTSGDPKHLKIALQKFIDKYKGGNISTAFLEVSIHFEEGAKKYGEYNWQKGIPTHCHIDSAVRHYLKFRRGDKDEPHDRAFIWRLLCCIWTCKHKPELNDYPRKEN